MIFFFGNYLNYYGVCKKKFTCIPQVDAHYLCNNWFDWNQELLKNRNKSMGKALILLCLVLFRRLKSIVQCIGESHPAYYRTDFLSKSREKSRWSAHGQTDNEWDTGDRCRPLIVHPRRLNTLCKLETNSTNQEV